MQTEQDIIAHYAEVKARLWSPPKRKAASTPVAPDSAHDPAPTHAWKVVPSPTSKIISEVLRRHNVTREEVRSASRLRRIVVARNECMFELWRAGQSLCWIGHWFDRDHTTCMHAIGQHCIATGQEHLAETYIATIRRKRAARKVKRGEG